MFSVIVLTGVAILCGYITWCMANYKTRKPVRKAVRRQCIGEHYDRKIGTWFYIYNDFTCETVGSARRVEG